MAANIGPAERQLRDRALRRRRLSGTRFRDSIYSSFFNLQVSQQVTELALFGAEIGARMMIGTGPARNSLDHADAAALELRDFVGVVGKQPNGMNIKSL